MTLQEHLMKHIGDIGVIPCSKSDNWTFVMYREELYHNPMLLARDNHIQDFSSQIRALTTKMTGDEILRDRRPNMVAGFFVNHRTLIEIGYSEAIFDDVMKYDKNTDVQYYKTLDWNTAKKFLGL